MIMYVLGINETSVYTYLDELSGKVEKIKWYFYNNPDDVNPLIFNSTLIKQQGSARIEKINDIPENTYAQVKVIVYYTTILDNGQNWEEHIDLSGFTLQIGRGMSASFSSSSREIDISLFGFDSNYQEQRNVYLFLNGITDSELLNNNNPIELEGGQKNYNFLIDAKNIQQYGNNIIIARIDLIDGNYVFFATEFYIAPPGQIEKNPKISVNYIRYNRENDHLEYSYRVENINARNGSVSLYINNQVISQPFDNQTYVEDEEYPPYAGIINVNDDTRNIFETNQYSWKIVAISYIDHNWRLEESYKSEESGYITIAAPGTTGASWIKNKEIPLGENKTGICSYYPQISADDFKIFCDDVQKKFDVDQDVIDEIKSKVQKDAPLKRKIFEDLLDCMGAEEEKEKLVMYVGASFNCFSILEEAYKNH